MRHFLFLLPLLVFGLLAGARAREFKDAELIGAWRNEANMAVEKRVYAANHTLRISFLGILTGSGTGVWGLEGDQLSTRVDGGNFPDRTGGAVKSPVGVETTETIIELDGTRMVTGGTAARNIYVRTADERDVAAEPVRMDTRDYPDDPRPAVADFFDAVRAGDFEKAMTSWDLYESNDEERKYDENQVRNTVKQMIAGYRMEEALKKMHPELLKDLPRDGLTPTRETILAAKFITFRRLAIVRWSENEDDGYPMELDTGTTPNIWRISMQQYRTTTRASVGDSMRMDGTQAEVFDEITRQILAGKINTLEEIGHMDTELTLKKLKEKHPEADEKTPKRKKGKRASKSK